MGEQATLRIDTPLGAGETRKLTGGYYRPPITPKGVSTVDRVEYGHNKATGLPGWNLHMTAKPGAGAVDVWFPRDETNLTIFCDEHNIKLPTVGKLAVNWRITWHKAGYQNVIDAIEALPEDAPVSELVKEFPRTSDGQPITLKKQHETDPAKCLHAMPAHVKREHDLDDSATGQAIRAIFGEPLPDAIRKRGVVLCWKMIEDYDEANKPGEVKARFAPQPPAPANASENGQGAAQTPPPAIPIAPPTPAIAGDVPSALPAPVKEQSVNYPESPIVVFPQSNGSVIYKGIRFSVTLRLGGKFADALPLMDDFVKAHENKLIEIDPACLINRPATVMLPPAPSASAPAPVPAAPAPAANGSSTVHIAAIKKVTDEGKTRYELFSDMAADKPALTVRLESVVRDVIAKHIDVNALQIGTRYQVNWTATYTTTEKFSKQANKNVTYRDLATIAPAV